MSFLYRPPYVKRDPALEGYEAAASEESAV